MEITGSGSSNRINRVLSQLGISFVKDRSVCSLSDCGRAPLLCQPGAGKSPRKRGFGESSGDVTAACAVCQDRPSGCHYGAVTCDGCKEFFKQSARAPHIYDSCHFSRACDLRLQRRNHCRSCRWDRCLQVGMVPSAVGKRRVTDSHRRVSDFLNADRVSTVASEGATNSPAATPLPSLPSPTDTESSRSESGDEESDRRLALHLLSGRPSPELPVSADMVLATLTPLESPETLAGRLTELERACLVDLFRWNKRRSDSNFGAAAANWLPILLASSVRHYLAGSRAAAAAAAAAAASPGGSLATELRDRLGCLLRGREFEFEPQFDELDSLMAHIGDLCSELLDAVLELKRDVLSDIILMLGDQTEEEMLASLESDRRPPRQSPAAMLLRATRSIAAAAGRLRSARPEPRALLLVALVSDAAAPSSSVATGGGPLASDEDSIQVPVLFGL